MNNMANIYIYIYIHDGESQFLCINRLCKKEKGVFLSTLRDDGELPPDVTESANTLLAVKEVEVSV